MTLDLNQIHAIRIEFETYYTGTIFGMFFIHVIDDVRIWFRWRRLPTMSHRKLVDQYTVGLTPLTNCRCLELEILSSIKIITKLAGIKDMAKITQVATNTSALLLNLKQEETAWPCWQTHSMPFQNMWHYFINTSNRRKIHNRKDRILKTNYNSCTRKIAVCWKFASD